MWCSCGEKNSSDTEGGRLTNAEEAELMLNKPIKERKTDYNLRKSDSNPVARCWNSIFVAR